MNYGLLHASSFFHFLRQHQDLLIILAVALFIRLISFNGAFGSDDLVYFERASQISRGEWTSSNYNGALRYGFNLPAAGFIFLFGPSLFVANIWPLTCSMIEIGAVYLFTLSTIGNRAAYYAAVMLACTPLHMAVATRIHADPVVSMFVTLSFVLLYFGMTQRKPLLLFTCGLAVGGIFWTKELAAVTWFSFIPVIWIFHQRGLSIALVAWGTATMMLTHGALMWVIAGDPMHLVRVVLSAMKHNFIDAKMGEDSANYYLKYLFFDLRHMGLLALMAIGSAVYSTRIKKTSDQLFFGYVYTVYWLLGLIVVLSIFPVSLSPLRLPMKQSNYITLFLAPVAVLSGFFLSMLPRRTGQLTLIAGALVGIMLGFLQQADYRAFTANSKALAGFAASHPRDLIIGSTNNSSLGNLWTELNYPAKATAGLISFRDLKEHEVISYKKVFSAERVYTVIDPQTLFWFSGPHPVTQSLPCWSSPFPLIPIELGLGNKLAQVALSLMEGIPMAASILAPLAYPKPSTIYLVPDHDLTCTKK